MMNDQIGKRSGGAVLGCLLGLLAAADSARAADDDAEVAAVALEQIFQRFQIGRQQGHDVLLCHSVGDRNVDRTVQSKLALVHLAQHRDSTGENVFAG